MTMFNDTITLYVCTNLSDGLNQWQRVIIRGVYWNAVKGAITRRTGVQSDNSVQLIIPLSVLGDGVKPKPNDIVVLGDTGYDIVKSSAELRQFDTMINITSVDLKQFGGRMAHYEVMGK